MTYTIKSRKIGKEITFSRPGKYYIYVDLNGLEGTLGNQICEGGRLSGGTIGCYDEDNFEMICKKWWKAYLRNERKF